jgi:hypothetical protein
MSIENTILEAHITEAMPGVILPSTYTYIEKLNHIKTADQTIHLIVSFDGNRNIRGLSDKRNILQNKFVDSMIAFNNRGLAVLLIDPYILIDIPQHTIVQSAYPRPFVPLCLSKLYDAAKIPTTTANVEISAGTSNGRPNHNAPHITTATPCELTIAVINPTDFVRSRDLNM